MNTNRLTQKAQEAVIAAQDLARQNGQSEIGTLHLLKALVDQPQGIVPHLLGRMGVDSAALDGAVRIQLERLPQVSGGAEPGVSRAPPAAHSVPGVRPPAWRSVGPRGSSTAPTRLSPS